MSLVERDQDLAGLMETLGQCLDGVGGVILVTGAVGLGKTELLLAFCQMARASGVVVLRGVGSRAERGLPLGLLAQLFDRSEAVATLLTAMRRNAEDAHAGDADSELLVPANAVLLDALWRELKRMSDEAPLLVVVDDAHHTDPQSGEVLMFLMRRCWSARMMFAIAESDHAWAAASTVRTEISRLPNLRRARLRPLSRDGVARIVAEHAPAAQESGFASACLAASAGNPFLLRTLLDDHHVLAHTVRGALAAEPLLGESFAQAVLTCVYSERETVVATARAAAVLGDTAQPAALARLTGLDPSAMAQAVARLSRIGLLDGAARFRHPAARAAVLDDMPAAERTDIHRQAARILCEDAAPAEAVAGHLIAGADERGEPWMAHVLAEAAAGAIAGGNRRFGIECLELAIRSSTGEEQLAALRSRLVQAAWRINPFMAMRHVTELMDALRGGRMSRSDIPTLARALLWHGRLNDAADALRRFPADADTAAAAEIEALRLWLPTTFPTVSLPASPSSEDGAARPGQASAEAARLLAAVLNGVTANAAAEAERILDGIEIDDAGLETVETVVSALVYADQLDDAERWAETMAAAADPVITPCWQARSTALHAEITLRRGDPYEAQRLASDALDQLPAQGWGVAIGAPLATLALAATAMGKYDEAAQRLRQPVPEIMFETRYGLLYLHARGSYQLARGRAHKALGDFQTVAERMVRWNVDYPGLVPWRTASAEAHLQIGDVEQARRLAQDQAVLLGGRTRAHGMSLRLLAAVADPEHRLTLLGEAVEVLAQSGDRVELARAMVDLHQAYRELGDDRLARRILAPALRAARAVCAEPLRRLLLDDLVVLGDLVDGDLVDDEGDDTPPAIGATGLLSEAERRVAFLAALDYSNREIASQLHITVSTVEQHLTRVYRKLQIRNRKDLAESVANPIRLEAARLRRAGGAMDRGARASRRTSPPRT
jgi:DNA-binding CsgD family transcriptional regulator